ncbi:CamS family sex pheromone protein [Paenisporosarcina cavernae]|uniref:CamS family sex pheromone protein n=1 Tax=Paenisporosarcina cavernae TaxID=2320858 RepID=A0A385YZ32_9BACL|nr:CamS family sex pheromone protein [Paenisporosarcina cavernae]AYC30833.1 CamS family sex pheromone protein [Paenisporosarcina cavernae]
MKKMSWIPGVLSLMLLGGCMPSLNNDTEVVTDNEEDTDVATTIIPNNQISSNYYRTLLPFKESASQGLTVSNIGTKYDIQEVDNGLMRLSKRTFSPEKYFFQEGQYLDRDTVVEWLGRLNAEDPFTGEKNEVGLNPQASPDMPLDERAKKAPLYLAHIVEQDYLERANENNVRLAGISIGLAMNSIYYYRDENGTQFQEPIPEDAMIKQGQKMANEIVSRMRQIDGLADIPIRVGLFKQQSRDAIVPGTYFATGIAAGGKGSVDNWEKINEEYVLFPQPESNEKYRGASEFFQNFKQDIDKYFTRYTSVIGTGYYQSDEIKSFAIEIPVQFYSEAEVIGFTQYTTGLVVDHFPVDLEVEVNISSINGPEALIFKKAGKEEPEVHIYTR